MREVVEQKTARCRQPGPGVIQEGGRGSWAGLCLRGLGARGEDGEAWWEELGLLIMLQLSCPSDLTVGTLSVLG